MTATFTSFPQETPFIIIIIILFHDGVTPVRTIDKCDRTDTSQKQLDGNYTGRQEAMDHEKQVGAKTLAGVIEVVNHKLE